MKDVYVIKVKTKPPLSSLYPSERRYSASTVGGLSLVHLGLGILSFLLGTLARSIQGPVLAFACMVPFASGLIAWRRWYIDKNISFFFYGSLLSMIVSILCGVATVFDVATVTESGYGNGPIWKLANFFQYPEGFDPDDKLVGIIERKITEEGLVEVLEERNETTSSEDAGEILQNRTNSILPSLEEEVNDVGYFPGVRNRLFSFWGKKSPATTRANLLLDVNVLVTCVLELCWSLLSVRISLRGMRNRIGDGVRGDNNAGFLPQRIKPPATDPDGVNQPDFRSRGGDDTYEDNLRSFTPNHRRNSFADHSGPRLPLPESNKEFRERVERFLANQAAHRIVEGSCS